VSVEIPTERQLTALELAVFKRGLSLDAALRKAAVTQIGRVVEALEAETTRLLEQTADLGPLDTAAALRVGRTWRQILPLALRLHAQEAPTEQPPPEPATPSLAAQIAARTAAEESDEDMQ
jgi:hypothetical protein